MNNTSIFFPHLGITFIKVGRYLKLGDFEIAYYGIVIAFAMMLGVTLIEQLAKKSGQNEEVYLTLCMIVLVSSVIGARVYYVIFSWDYYKMHLMEIPDIRGGGLAIYGGILTGICMCVLYARKNKLIFLRLADTIVPGLALGQAIGRWGNFFNREAFGGYTDGLFAMALPKAAVYSQDITAKMLEHILIINNTEFIQVHPTFLYESMWNFGLLLVLCSLYFHKKSDGVVFAVYLGGYGIGRFFIESLRTDQLLIGQTQIPVSMVVSVLMLVASAGILYVVRTKIKR